MNFAVYVSCAASGELHRLRLDGSTGLLTSQQVVAPGGQMMPMALSPDRRFLYAARRTPPREVLSYAIDPASGALLPLGTAALPDSMCSISTDRSGRWLFAASYGGGLASVGPIDPNGVAGEATQVIAVGAKAHAIAADPTNRRVLATSLGDGIVRSFDFDAATGRLEPTSGVDAFAPHAAASPRHFGSTGDGRFVYLLGELDAAIDVLAVDAATGALRTVQTVSAKPPGLDGEAWAADLHLTPDGRFLYASERRSGTIAAFRIDPDAGTLVRIDGTEVEAEPRGFNITPDGRYLIVAGKRSHQVAAWAIDSDSGRLALRSRVACGEEPNWVETFVLAS